MILRAVGQHVLQAVPARKPHIEAAEMANLCSESLNGMFFSMGYKVSPLLGSRLNLWVVKEHESHLSRAAYAAVEAILTQKRSLENPKLHETIGFSMI